MSDTPESLKGKGIAAFHAGNLTEALDFFKDAHTGFINAGHDLDAGEMLNNIGMVYREQEENEQALEYMKQACEIFAGLNDNVRHAQTLANLAPLYSSMKEYAKASMTFNEAEAMLLELDEPAILGEIYMSHGLHEFEHGNRRAALGIYERGLVMVPHPTGKQKRIRFLLKLRNRVMFNM